MSRNTRFVYDTCRPAPPRSPIHQRLQRVGMEYRKNRRIVYIFQPSLLLSMSLMSHDKFVQYFITLPLLFPSAAAAGAQSG